MIELCLKVFDYRARQRTLRAVRSGSASFDNSHNCADCYGVTPEFVRRIETCLKWLAILNVVCDNTFWVKRGTVLFMCGIFSKEVLSKHVVVEYRFSAEPYISASSGNVSVLSKSKPAG